MSAALALAVGLRIYGLYYMPHFGRKTRRAALAACGLERVFVQELSAADTAFIPDFSEGKELF